MLTIPTPSRQVLVLLIPLVWPCCWVADRLGAFWGLIALGLGAVAIGMTYARASWIGLAVAAAVFVFLWNRRLIPAFLLLGLLAPAPAAGHHFQPHPDHLQPQGHLHLQPFPPV